ncbi:hypothetical protein GCK72_024666 [Caenorhabditis remanei]|uniref:Peptidase M13 C-terminal domain-containing protein n=1 Tax=Caenorhabditis remanei TaxID=31234 RepID=A0A6A5G0Y4_CAERE|nr:hypothetical protein GCK72_024666 [Caenorhabditis remanei]KAF1748199.1 hypothetical protein GCK72_024666 [Caenorhabditis remanei]
MKERLIQYRKLTTFGLKRLIDENVNPCDNFYRHACPLRSIKGRYIEDAYERKLFKLKAKTAEAVWNNLAIQETFERAHYKEFPSLHVFIAKLFQKQCETENVTTEEKGKFLELIQETWFNHKNSECVYSECLGALASDRNCTRAAELLESKLYYRPWEEFTSTLRVFFIQTENNLEGINAILDDDLREGVSNVKNIVETMKKKLLTWIQQTPWVINNEAIESIMAEAEQVHHYDNFAKTFRYNLNLLLKLEQSYLKCLRDLDDTEELRVFCMLAATNNIDFKTISMDFFTFYNAMNGHPNLYFSHLFYDMAKNVESPAALLGSVGFIAGHELSHSLIENANHPDLIPYFSNDSMQCIQNQYQTTCDNFKETSCGANDNQIDENGSDILGIQLAYSLFEDIYSEKKKDEYIRLRYNNTITNDQLFFYSLAFISCKGEPGTQNEMDPHSPWNIRINAVVQHPGFRDAFNCDANSPMVQSFNDQCVIFGENAPQTRK